VQSVGGIGGCIVAAPSSCLEKSVFVEDPGVKSAATG
jgi:hypothetical protein